MLLLGKFNKGACFLFRVIDNYSKYVWIILLNNKKGITNQARYYKGRKSSKIWIDKDIEIYNRSMKSWLRKNDVEMYSTNDKGKSVVAERFIRSFL